MEWNRGGRPTQPAGTPVGHPVSAPGTTSSKKKKLMDSTKGLRYAAVFMLFATTILVVAVLGKMMMGPATESSFVDKDKMQAVFLNGGQVYFGKINDLNSQYMKVSDIYYLRVNQQVQPNQESTQSASNDISLVKLGCELHGPQDAMVINREQIIFWENLKTDGQVAKAVDEYKKQNPDGQKCDTSTNTSTDSSSQEETTPVAPASSTTPATNTQRR